MSVLAYGTVRFPNEQIFVQNSSVNIFEDKIISTIQNNLALVFLVVFPFPWSFPPLSSFQAFKSLSGPVVTPH